MQTCCSCTVCATSRQQPSDQLTMLMHCLCVSAAGGHRSLPLPPGALVSCTWHATDAHIVSCLSPAARVETTTSKASHLRMQSAAVLHNCVLPLLRLMPTCLWLCHRRWARTALVYTLMAVLVALLSLICVRYVLFTLVWVVSGHALWLFPNMMSDQVRGCFCAALGM